MSSRSSKRKFEVKMNDQLVLEKIYSKVLNKEVGKKDALKLFESLINKSDNEDIRYSGLEYIGKLSIEDELTFNIIENCLISDESALVRFEAAKVLIQNFPERDHKPLIWAIQNEKSIYFFKNLLDLLETDEYHQFKEIHEKALKKIRKNYSLNSADSRFVLDIDYLDYKKFKTEFKDFLEKFELSDKEKQKLIKENTEIGYKGLGRVKTAKKGFILSLSLKDLNEIPSSICKLSRLESLEISRCKLRSFPEACPDLRSVKNIVLKNNELDRIPDWVLSTVKKKKYSHKYVIDGVIISEAYLLGLLEILTGEPCKKMKGNNNNDANNTVCYSINNLGHITRIYYSNKNYRIGIFPKDICKLKFLEEISLNNQNISNIPECVGKLERLKTLNLSLNKIARVPESIKKLKNLENFYL